MFSRKARILIMVAAILMALFVVSITMYRVDNDIV